MDLVEVGTSIGVWGAGADVSRSWMEAADVEVEVAVLGAFGGSGRSGEAVEGAGDVVSHLKRLVDGSVVAGRAVAAVVGSKIEIWEGETRGNILGVAG